MKHIVLHVLNYSPIYKGNFFDSMEALNDELRKTEGENIYLFVKPSAKDRDWVQALTNGGRKVYFLSGEKKKDIEIIRKIISDEGVEFVHTHFLTTEQWILVDNATRGRKVTLIQHWHHHLPSPSFAKNMVRKFLWRRSYFIGVSESVTKELRVLFPKKVITVENAINYDRLDSFEEYPDMTKDAVNCLLFGYNWYVKGVDVALKAVKKLVDEGENIRLWISLSANKDIVDEKVKDVLDVSEAPDWIHLLTARNDVATYYRAADIFLSTSRQEGFCYSVVEAAYCGCKIVASRIPAQKDLEVPNVEWFESENSDDLARAIKMQIGKTAECGDAQKDALKKRYSLNVWVKNMLNVYDRLGK